MEADPEGPGRQRYANEHIHRLVQSPCRGILFHLHPYYLFRHMAQPGIYQTIHEKREESTRLARTYGASHIRIFGSVARHTADEKSDTGFLVELEPGRTLSDLGGFAYDLEQLLGRPVDVCTVSLLLEPIRTRVVSETVLL
jgi:predicted nucleotidyltransferase